MIKNKNPIDYIVIYLVFIFIFGIYPDFLFFLSPLIFYLMRDIFSFISILVVIKLLLLRQVSFKRKPERFFLGFVVIQCFFLPVYSALLAYIHYNQPVIYGLLAERGRLLSVSCIIFYSYLQQSKFTLQDFHNIFLRIAWFCLFAYLIFRVLYEIQPAIFTVHDKLLAEKGLGMFDSRDIETKGGVIMRVSTILFVYAIIFYFIQYLDGKRILSLLKILTFVLFIVVFNKGRGIIIFLLLTLLVYYWKNSKASNKMMFGIFAGMLIGALFVGGISTSAGSPSFFNSFFSIIETVQTVQSTDDGAGVADASTWARLYDLGVIAETFAKSNLNWLFGMGLLSNQYNGGTTEFISEYFYPVDVGIAGAVFLYGVVVVLIYKALYVKMRDNFKSLTKQPSFIKAIKYFMVFLFISSIQTGADMLGNPEIFICFFGFSLVYYLNKARELNDNWTLQYNHQINLFHNGN
jgi:hypothetical protein